KRSSKHPGLLSLATALQLLRWKELATELVVLFTIQTSPKVFY
ncbi:unnamed protein product, partial [Allacma fusca]